MDCGVDAEPLNGLPSSTSALPLEKNPHPLGQIFYAFSTMICTPASKSQEVGLALGAQAGEKRLTEVLKEGGFTRARLATDTPTNMVLEARA